MNTPQNKRYLEIADRIDDAFASLLQDAELQDISVADICKIAGIERCTFYAHYEDISVLTNSYAAKIERQVYEQPHACDDFTWLFEYIKNHPDTFDIYFKLGLSKLSGDYKTSFFRNGVYAVAKMWFEGGCVEPSDQMGSIIFREYTKLNLK